jgi:hypothetical protein
MALPHRRISSYCSENIHIRRDARKGVRGTKLEYNELADGLPAVPSTFSRFSGAIDY